ncbi:hypothetical protein [Autumnicola musiva]|uniref:Nucleoside phosphorylase domain-containing protein n=1 Tax=Autumnicola musiva TaxID=3075589 RepID=A0ABU3DB25_9FLAO|nr:hypothetical protein [Zunongwangia sp. F117]MDT0678727.1 hypothetical protein [Zunongwangia sp. F117]
MKSKEVTLLVLDNQKHFDEYLVRLGKDSFHEIHLVQNEREIRERLMLLNGDEKVCIVVHAFYQDLGGIKNFQSWGIVKDYPLLSYLYATDGNTDTVKEMMKENELDEEEVYKYHKVRAVIENDELEIASAYEILGEKSIDSIIEEKNYDYVIITALEVEMSKIRDIIEEQGCYDDNESHVVYYGRFKDAPDKKVIYVSQLETGMIDASILATEMIIRFSPKYLIMSGVLGGRPNKTELGDVVISKQIFTVDKGKLKNGKLEKEIENVYTGGAITQKIETAKKHIKRFLEDEFKTGLGQFNIHVGPVACVRQVIDQDGYFESNIVGVDRKAIALEMEGYGIARACEIVNNKKTKPLIIKSVMDNTKDKTDSSKDLAAWTSAQTIRFLIKENLI